MTTLVSVGVLQAALRRKGFWIVDQTGLAIVFIHNACFTRTIAEAAIKDELSRLEGFKK